MWPSVDCIPSIQLGPPLAAFMSRSWRSRSWSMASLYPQAIAGPNSHYLEDLIQDADGIVAVRHRIGEPHTPSLRFASISVMVFLLCV
jgi:hypothetical protein